MKLIGLTGGAGSGKSTVAQMFRELGAAVVDADEATHSVYEPGTPGFDAVVREFGREYVGADGRIDRVRLGELVFNDEQALRRLNATVHPLVRRWMTERTAEALESGAPVVIQDIPLLFESNLQGLFASTVLVYAAPATQASRLVDVRGLSHQRAGAILAAQMPIDKKRALADIVIDNDGSLEATRRQVERVWPGLVSRAV
ncbi:MAG TPA: dephospho-CoA kinase [Candidatus Dormibacteraeota bacterium]|nr:dephospho-CoA kinase [Candidatus Dormibacteraeota bacterium]